MTCNRDLWDVTCKRNLSLIIKLVVREILRVQKMLLCKLNTTLKLVKFQSDTVPFFSLCEMLFDPGSISAVESKLPVIRSSVGIFSV